MFAYRFYVFDFCGEAWTENKYVTGIWGAADKHQFYCTTVTHMVQYKSIEWTKYKIILQLLGINLHSSNSADMKIRKVFKKQHSASKFYSRMKYLSIEN